LTIRKFRGAILVGIIITAIVAFVAGTSPWPKHLVKLACREALHQSSGNSIFVELSPGGHFQLF